MYYAHFGLKEPPFKITPNTDMFFTGGNRGAILDAIVYAILNGEGITKVVGEVGSGKTMLCRMLQTMLPDRIESIYLANPSVAPEDVLHAIAFELQLKLPKNADRLKVMQALQTHLLMRHAAGKQVVIFVEEAQGMPIATLEEIRLLSNLETNHDKLLQIVLFGQPELDENLNEIHIRQLRERITHSFNLKPLHIKEIGEYLIFRLRAAGYYGPPLFMPAAVKKLAGAAKGLVRRVNILADKALLAAFSENVYQVTPKHIEAAIADSEFGLEKTTATYWYKWMVGGVLLGLGLLLGYYANSWQQGNAVKTVAHEKVAATPANPIFNRPRAREMEAIPAPGKSGESNEKSIINPTVNANTETQKAATQTILGTNISAVPQDLLTRRVAITKAWLENQPPTTVSIQIMGAGSDAQINHDLQALGQQIELDQLYVYRTKVNQLPFITVLYGSFENRLAAVKALKALPPEILKNKPQLRTVAGVLQETK